MIDSTFDRPDHAVAIARGTSPEASLGTSPSRVDEELKITCLSEVPELTVTPSSEIRGELLESLNFLVQN
jgi:hypothetical protein